MPDAGTGRVGTRFGPYEIRELIGRGGMGEVYRAYDTVKDREVALKLLPADLARDSSYRERFQREARVAARLQEPHVIPIHDFGEIDGVLYIDMRLVRGKDLRAVLRRPELMNPEAAVEIVRQIGDALDAAHADGLVHRDVKPENVLMLPSGFAYLADFGIASRSDDVRITSAGTAIGSFAYMAPERFQDVPSGPAVDIYALGCVLHECLTGRPPFERQSVPSMIQAHLNEAPARVSSLRDLPRALDAVIGRALAKDPAMRFTSARAFAEAAQSALKGDLNSTSQIQKMQSYGLPAAHAGFQSSEPASYADQGPYTSGSTSGPVHSRNRSTVWLVAAIGVLLILAGFLGYKILNPGGTDNGQGTIGTSTSTSTSGDTTTSSTSDSTTSSSTSETTTSSTSSSSSSSSESTTSSSSSKPGGWDQTIADGDGYNWRGWVDYPNAQCSGDDRAALVASTSSSLMVICESHSGSMYYLGLRPGQTTQPNHIRLSDPTRTEDGWEVKNAGQDVDYLITSSNLRVVDNRNMQDSNEPVNMFEEVPKN